MTPKEKFLLGADGDNHRALLWLALDLTKESVHPVMELGAGDGSTPYLRDYCRESGREFISWDSDKHWGEQWDSQHTESWHNPKVYGKRSVVLVDQGPGEDRKESIKILQQDAEIIVVHDAEPDNENCYQLYTIYPLFKYKILTKGEKVWTAALSNQINLFEHQNTFINNQRIEL